MSIFNYLDYRAFLRAELKKRKRDIPGFTQAELARQAGIPITYLTNVLMGRGNFNSDQIFALAEHLKLAEAETRYLFILKELDQSTSPARKARLQDEIAQLRRSATKTESHISAKVRSENPQFTTRYYADPLIKVVHILLQIKRFAEDPESLGPALNLRPTRVRQILDTLVDLEIVRFHHKAIEVLQKNYHLPKESPMLLPHQMLMRLKSGERLMELPPEKRYSFSVTLSSDEETRRFIHERFLDFLGQIEKKVKASTGEHAYQLNFELFPWTEES